MPKIGVLRTSKLKSQSFVQLEIWKTVVRNKCPTGQITTKRPDHKIPLAATERCEKKKEEKTALATKTYRNRPLRIVHNMRVNTICCVYSHYSYPKDII